MPQLHSMLAKDSRIVIVGGAGTMGSSTALHLARRGYTDVRIIDQFQPPSANSAGNDMNKVRFGLYVSLMLTDVVDSVRLGHMGQARFRDLGCLE